MIILRSFFPGGSRGRAAKQVIFQEPISMPDTKCPKCGAEIPAEAEWCPHCGRQPSGIRIHHVLFAVGCLILLGLLILGFMHK